MCGHFTNIIANFTVFVAQGEQVGMRASVPIGKENQGSDINFKSTLYYFCEGLLGYGHLPNRRKTRSHLISLKSAWEPSMPCGWRVRHSTLPHSTGLPETMV